MIEPRDIKFEVIDHPDQGLTEVRGTVTIRSNAFLKTEQRTDDTIERVKDQVRHYLLASVYGTLENRIRAIYFSNGDQHVSEQIEDIIRSIPR